MLMNHPRNLSPVSDERDREQSGSSVLFSVSSGLVCYLGFNFDPLNCLLDSHLVSCMQTVAFARVAFSPRAMGEARTGCGEAI